VLADYGLLGVAQGRHVLALLRPGLAEEGATACEDVAALPHDAPVRVAGRLEVLQRPQTAKGIVFATLEDETGMANLVCYPDVFEGFRQVVRDHSVLIADGRIQQEHGVTHVIVGRLRGVRLETEAAGEAAIGPKWGTASGPGAASGNRRGAVVGPGKEFE
jgi:error-prone DNA polymerase